MKIPHLFPVAAVLFSLHSAEFTAESDKQTFDQANLDFSAGRFDTAHLGYTKYLENNPNDIQAYYKKASAGLVLGKLYQSLEDLNKLLQLSPNYSKALIQRSKIYIKLGSLSEALKDLSIVSESSPENLVVKEMLEEIKQSQSKAQLFEDSDLTNEPEKAMDILSELINVSPHWADMRKKRAHFAFTQNKFDEALGDWTKVIQISPSDHDTLHNLARTHYYFYHEPEQALNKVKQFLHYDPEHKKFKSLFRSIKQTEKKLASLETFAKKKMWKDVISLLEGDEETQGLFQLVAASTSSILSDFKTDKLGPNRLNGKLYTTICLAYSRTRNAKTIDYCSKALEIFPEDYKSLVARSEGYLVKELYELAIQDLTKAFELSDKDKKIHEKLQKAKTLFKQSKQNDYYKVLGVSRSAGPKEIKKAFLKKAREWHPDTYKGDLPQVQVEKKMAEINQAYEVLSDEELKAKFDRGEDPNDPTGGHGHPGGNPFGQGNPFEFMFQKGGGFGQGSHFEFNF